MRQFSLLFFLILLTPAFILGQSQPPDDKGKSADSNSDSSTQSEPAPVMVDGTQAHKVENVMVPPRPIKSPSPKYPKEARNAKYEGTSVLWVVVDKNGLPRDVRVKTKAGFGLDEAAVKTVAKWRFKPATNNGVPVAMIITVEVAFKLY